MVEKKDIKKIFELYYTPLVQYANRFLGSMDECEDLVQDVFVDYWEKNRFFPDEIYLKVYLYKAVRNKCYNVIKHTLVKSNYAKNSMQSIEDDDLFLRELLEEEIVFQLNKAVSLLPRRKQEIIKLSLKGLKNGEIAQELGIQLQTVKTLKTQSYKILREQFKEVESIIYFLVVHPSNIELADR